MAGPVILRPIALEDLDAIVEVRRDLVGMDDLMCYPHKTPSRAEVEDWLSRKLADPGVVLHAVAAPDGACVGYTQLNGRHLRGRYAWYGVAIAPRARGRGYAGMAVRALIEHARDALELRKLLAEVLDGNAASLALHHRAGFEPVGRLRRHYKDRSDTWRDVIVMERFLDPA